jgi:hypothetical protein
MMKSFVNSIHIPKLAFSPHPQQSTVVSTVCKELVVQIYTATAFSVPPGRIYALLYMSSMNNIELYRYITLWLELNISFHFKGMGRGLVRGQAAE